MPAETNRLLASLRGLDKQSMNRFARMFGVLGVKGLVMLSRTYLGPLAGRAVATPIAQPETEPRIVDATGAAAPTSRVAGLDARDLAILGLAATKAVYELGELALHNPTLDPKGPQPVFALDDSGRAPAISLAHVFAATRMWRSLGAPATTAMAAVAAPAAPRARLYAARSEYYGTAARFTYAATPTRTPKANTMVTHARPSSSGCASCGGSHRLPEPPPTPIDPCAGGLAPPPRPHDSCGCGGTCSSCKQRTRTYDAEQCPTFAISCETKLAVRDCMKLALCDFLRCLSDTLCPDGKFDSDVFDTSKNPDLVKQLVDCVGQLACTFMHCVPDALCEPAHPPPTKVIDCLPCDYAVEVVR